jgi:hypothetical protein
MKKTKGTKKFLELLREYREVGTLRELSEKMGHAACYLHQMENRAKEGHVFREKSLNKVIAQLEQVLKSKAKPKRQKSRDESSQPLPTLAHVPREISVSIDGATIDLQVNGAPISVIANGVKLTIERVPCN